MKKNRNIIPVMVIVIGLLVLLHKSSTVSGQITPADSLSGKISRSQLDLKFISINPDLIRVESISQVKALDET